MSGTAVKPPDSKVNSTRGSVSKLGPSSTLIPRPLVPFTILVSHFYGAQTCQQGVPAGTTSERLPLTQSATDPCHKRLVREVFFGTLFTLSSSSLLLPGGCKGW